MVRASPDVPTTNAASGVPALDHTLPLPGRGRTWDRWRALAAVAAADPVAARLGEGHVDAIAILAELAPTVPVPRGRLGVWAAEAPRGGITATRRGDGWRIDGERGWCSGATTLDHALVTAHADDGLRLFVVPVAAPAVAALAGTWPAVGMAASDSLTMRFDALDVPACAAVGGPGAYLSRPGFWHGAIGVAACWYGGAVGVASTLYEHRPTDPHGLAHLGAIDSLLSSMRDTLQLAARAIDDDPADLAGLGEIRARRVRAAIERGCEDVLARTGHAAGAEPLCHDGEHARRVADLTVYLRQSHAERDLQTLGELAATTSARHWLS